MKMDQFPVGLGVQLTHCKAMPSPLGLKERGDYRRPDALDTVGSNGMIYMPGGLFTATFVSNTDSKKWGEAGQIDDSTARLIMPRFYDIPPTQSNSGAAKGPRIYPAIGDRLYIADPDADVHVPFYQRMEYNGQGMPDQTMFPVCQVEFLQDSRGINYYQGADFEIDLKGNIAWIQGGHNPGIDPSTGLGRVYAVRYLYRAYWYISQIPNEIRITNVTENGIRTPERLPYHLIVQREFVYHNINNSSKPITMKQSASPRVVQEQRESITDNGGDIVVNMQDIERAPPLGNT